MNLAENNEREIKMKYLQLSDGTVIETESPEHWTEAKPLTKAKGKELMREQARSHLRKVFKPGDTAFTVLRHVSRSGMCRHISILAVEDGELRDVSGWAGQAMDSRRNDKDGSIIVGGCGMDMGFHLVYNLGYVLWPKGTPKPHGTRNGEPDQSGGYALKQKWI